MAVRTPLYYDGSSIREMSASDITAIKNRCIYVYGANPSVDLSRVSSGGNISPTMTDNRLKAGAATSSSYLGPNTPGNNSDDYNALSPGGVVNVPITYDHISQTIESLSEPTDTNNRRNFLYQISGDIYAMSNTDMYDTFYDDVIDDLVDGNNRPGIYNVQEFYDVTDMTRVSDSVVFKDTRANASAYTASGIAETRDQPTTIKNYYLHRVNQSIMTNPTISNQPLFIRTDGDFQQHQDTTLDVILTADIRYWATQKISYNINGSGNQVGEAMKDTKLNSSVRRNRQIGSTGSPSTTYRSQVMPAGTASDISTYTLKITRS